MCSAVCPSLRPGVHELYYESNKCDSLDVISWQINHTNHKTNLQTAGSNTEFECNEKYELTVYGHCPFFLK